MDSEKPAIELRLRRMLDRYPCDCTAPDVNPPRRVYDHSHNCQWRILNEAADECEELNGMHALIQRQGDLLSGVVNVLRGKPHPLVLWSHHDAPELAQLYRDLYDAVLAAELLNIMPKACDAVRAASAAIAKTIRTGAGEEV